jgi:hypothetical protein
MTRIKCIFLSRIDHNPSSYSNALSIALHFHRYYLELTRIGPETLEAASLFRIAVPENILFIAGDARFCQILTGRDRRAILRTEPGPSVGFDGCIRVKGKPAKKESCDGWNRVW